MLTNLFDFLVILLIMTLMFSAAYVAAVLLIGVMDKIMGKDDLHDVFARDRAMDALRRMADDDYMPAGNGPTMLPAFDGIDFCRLCNGRILTENSYEGICDDCWREAERREPARDDEWRDLMRAIEDEQAETEDHR